MKFKLSLLGMLVANACIATAVAQQQPAEDTIEEITVTGIRGSVAAAMDTKRDSSGFVDALVAEDISDFPDLNLSEALQRIPGVAISRQNGEGQSVTVRALGPEFTQVRLNNQTVTSPGGRSVDLDIFASELMQSISLVKSPSAEMTEGGLAATIDMKTRRPFDKEGFVAAASVQGQHNSLVEDWDPRYSFLVSNTWGDKFGALVSFAQSDYTLRQDAIENIRWETESLGGGTLPLMEIPFLPRSINQFRDRKRTGITASLQYRPVEDVEVNLDIVHGKFDELNRRFTIDTLYFDGTPNPVSLETVPGIGGLDRVVGGVFDNVQTRSENVFDDTQDELNMYTLSGKWNMNSNLTLEASAGYSKAEQLADNFRSLYDFRGRAELGETSYEGTVVPTFSSLDYDFTDASAYGFNQLRYLMSDIEDEEKNLKFDVTYNVDWGIFSALKAGVRYAEHEFSRVAYDERINPNQDNPAPAFEDVASLNYGLFGGGTPDGIPSDWLIVQRDDFEAAQTMVANDFVPAISYPSTYRVKEDTLAGYAQLSVDTPVGDGMYLTGNLGVRVVKTDQTSTGYVLTDSGVGTIGEESDYTDVLPSINLSLDVTEDVIIRLAASKAMTRATLSQLSPGISSYDIATQSASQGNPNLDPFRVKQIDLGVEYYFAEDALVSFTGFFKDIESFITTTTESRVLNFGGPLYRDDGTDISNEAFNVSLPVNGKGAKIRGLEFIYQQPLTFLPIEGFGVIVNYTYAKTDGVTHTYYGESFETPFAGASENSYNLTGYYENDEFSVRLAYAWRDEFVTNAAGDSQSTLLQDAYGQLDLSTSYSLTDSIDVSLDVLNVTDETFSQYGLTKDRSVGVYGYGRTIVAGVQIAF